MNEASRPSDRELFEAAASGASDATAALVSRYVRGLYDFALRGTLDEQQAAAAVEAVFRRLTDPASEVPSQVDTRTWLYSLALVEVLAVSSETRRTRVSSEDQRLYEPTAGDPEIASWAWQAARGLRTRDYCVLDLTLRRGLTPEEVAEAASLTRSNLYASIGRARGAFEESFAAVLLFERGRDACMALDDLVENAPGTGLRPALRQQIVEHSDSCVVCRRTLDAFPPAASIYISLPEVDVPPGLSEDIERVGAAPEPPPDPWASPPPGPLEGRPLDTKTRRRVPELFSPVPVPVDAPAGRDDPLWSQTGDRATHDSGADAETEVDEQAFAGLPLPSSAGDSAAASLNIDPVSPAAMRVRRDVPSEDEWERTGEGGRLAAWLGIGQGPPLLWSYVLLGVLAVVAVYIGVAVADSLQSGGRDSGAVPLDTPPGATSSRVIDCGDAIELEAGEPVLISFDEAALDGFRIDAVAASPISAAPEEGDLEVIAGGPYSLQFIPRASDSPIPRSDQYDLRIDWLRGEEPATSLCRVVVNIAP